MDLYEFVAKKFAKYPLSSQDRTPWKWHGIFHDDTVFSMKFYLSYNENIYWYLSEYDPEKKLLFWLARIHEKEAWYISLEELFSASYIWVDFDFKPTTRKELKEQIKNDWNEES